jgi:hypothetical protein
MRIGKRSAGQIKPFDASAKQVGMGRPGLIGVGV